MRAIDLKIDVKTNLLYNTNPSTIRVMGTAAGASPAALASLACFCVLLLLGFLKVAFSVLAAEPTTVGDKEGRSMISKIGKLNCFAAAFFDSVHAILVSAVVVAVP